MISALQGSWPFDTYQISWLARSKHVLVYPIAKGKVLNIVAYVATKKEDLGDTTQENWTLVTDKSCVQQDFSDFDEPVKHMLDVMNETPLKWIIYDHHPSKRWLFAGGKVALLGDAAHAMVPHQGLLLGFFFPDV